MKNENDELEIYFESFSIWEETGRINCKAGAQKLKSREFLTSSSEFMLESFQTIFIHNSRVFQQKRKSTLIFPLDLTSFLFCFICRVTAEWTFEIYISET